jgi:hypothetical protein
MNFDMIGRLRENRLVVGGAGTSPAFKALLQKANTDGPGPSPGKDGGAGIFPCRASFSVTRCTGRCR